MQLLNNSKLMYMFQFELNLIQIFSNILKHFFIAYARNLVFSKELYNILLIVVFSLNNNI